MANRTARRKSSRAASTGAPPPGAPDPAEAAERIHSAAIHLLRRLRRSDGASGLSAPRLSVLSILVYAGPRTLGELAALEQVRPPSMTRLIQALEADGHVARAPHPGDRRIVRISATARGRRALLRARDARLASLTSSLSELPARELATVLNAAAILEKLGGSLPAPHACDDDDPA